MPAEATWTIIPPFIFIGMFAWGANIYYRNNQVPKNAIDVDRQVVW